MGGSSGELAGSRDSDLEEPCFGGAQVFFPNLPDVDLHLDGFSGAWHSAMSKKLLKRVLRKMTLSLVTDSLVLPKRTLLKACDALARCTAVPTCLMRGPPDPPAIRVVGPKRTHTRSTSGGLEGAGGGCTATLFGVHSYTLNTQHRLAQNTMELSEHPRKGKGHRVALGPRCTDVCPPRRPPGAGWPSKYMSVRTRAYTFLVLPWISALFPKHPPIRGQM